MVLCNIWDRGPFKNYNHKIMMTIKMNQPQYANDDLIET